VLRVANDKSRTPHAQGRTLHAQTYYSILRGEQPELSEDSIKNIHKSLQEILEEIERYRQYEGIDMMYQQKAKLIGISKYTIRTLDRVYREFKESGSL
jgi:hypothetical protein